MFNRIYIALGTYPIKPCLPAVGGNEGVGEVLAVGSGVKNINVGDWVLMASSGQGKFLGFMTTELREYGDLYLISLLFKI